MSDELFELPEGWVWTTIGDFAEVTKLAGFEFTNYFKYQELGDVRVIRGLNVGFGEFKAENFKYIDACISDALPRSQLRGGEILITYVGTLGSVAVLPQDGNRYHLGPNVGKISVKDEISNARYLMFFLLSPLGRESIHQTSKAVAQSSLSMKQIRSLSVPLPPLNEQKRIVAKIEELRDRLHRSKQALEAIPQLCDRFRQSVLAAAFRGDLTADWREENPDVEPASVLLERIRSKRRAKWEASELEKMSIRGTLPKNEKWKDRYKDPELIDSADLFELPEGWIWTNANHLCWQITDGEHNQPKYKPEGFPMLTAKHVRDGFVNMSDSSLIAEEDFKKARLRCAPDNGDLLIVSVGATTGRAAVIYNCIPFAIVRSVLLLKPLINANFILNWTRTRWCQLWIGKASGATAQAHLYINDTKEMPIPLPPLSEQEEILNRINLMFEHMNSIENTSLAELAKLDRLNQSILAKAFRGELVEQDPNDEPASVLLDRIRAERQAQESKKSGGTRGKRKKASGDQLKLPGVE